MSNTDLRGAKLTADDLSYADFTGADLRGAELANANLCKAKISDEQLCTVSKLKGATMPDGSKYDGRYNLSGDLSDARGYIKNLNKDPGPEQIAGYYYFVSLRKYLAGQKWADKNLAKVCGDRGE